MVDYDGPVFWRSSAGLWSGVSGVPASDFRGIVEKEGHPICYFQHLSRRALLVEIPSSGINQGS